jgi:nitrogen fixation protein FixH
MSSMTAIRVRALVGRVHPQQLHRQGPQHGNPPISTFGGTVVDNSYVASQEFNGWLAAAKKQQQLGWKTGVSIDSERHVHIAASSAGIPVEGLAGSGQASHPLGAKPPIELSFSVTADGSLKSVQALPGGRWLVHAVLRRGDETVKLAKDLQ